MKPLVSIVTATRNRPELLERVVNILARQTFFDFEWIAVDDGSDLSVLEFYETLWKGLDDRFLLIGPKFPSAPGTGPAAARNRGIQHARGKYVAFLDDDDLWLKDDHLEVALKSLEEMDADYYFTNMQGHRDNIGVLCPRWYSEPPLTAGRRVSKSHPIYEVPLGPLMKVMKQNYIHPINSVVRRSVLLGIGGFVNRLSYGEDYNLMMRVADASRRTLFRDEICVSYRYATGNSISLSYSRCEANLQMLFSTNHVRVSCVHREVRNAARARLAWIMRTIAGGTEFEICGWEALLYQWQALNVYPTAGTVVGLLKCIPPAIADRWGRIRKKKSVSISGDLNLAGCAPIDEGTEIVDATTSASS